MLLQKKDLTFFNILYHKKTGLAFGAGFFSMFNVSYHSSFLTVWFMRHYGITSAHVGYVYLCLTGPYLIGCVIQPFALKNVPNRL